MQPRPDRRLAGRLILASVLALVLTFVCYFLMLRTALGQRFDYSAHIGSYPVNPNFLAGNSMRGLTPYVFALVVVALLVIGFMRRRPVLGIAAAVAAGVAVLVTDGLKDEILTRPHLTSQVPRAANTFPSGHAVAAMVCAVALIVVVPPRWRTIVAIVAGGYGWLTAVQQQIVSSHYPSDVVGAILLAFAAVAGMTGLLAWFRPVESGGRVRFYGLAQLVLGLAGLVAAGLSVWGIVKVLNWLGSHAVAHRPTASINHDAYLTGLAVTMAVGIAVVMAFLALLRDAELR